MHLLRFAQDQPSRLIIPATAQLPQQIVWQPLIRVMVREPKAQHPRLTDHAAGPTAMFGRCHRLLIAFRTFAKSNFDADKDCSRISDFSTFGMTASM
jgi:hypothetical protein